jgi:hypothetical protein
MDERKVGPPPDEDKINERLKNSPAVPYFMLPTEPGKFSEALDLVCLRLPERHRPAMESYRKNVNALLSTMYLPFRMCIVAAERQRYSLILAAERIRMIPITDVSEESLSEEERRKRALPQEERERRAVQKAKEKFAVEMASEESRNSCFVHAFFYFEELVQDPGIALALRELMRQGLVLAWSAIEALANDLFRSLVNEKPAFSELLLQDERTKKRFQVRDAVGILASYNYDLSEHMGDALNENCKLDDVETIRCVFDVLFPEDEKLRTELTDEALWKLFQRRNLIVHRRSIVDQVYLDNTGDKVALGSELPISQPDVDKATAVLFTVGCGLLSAVVKTQRMKFVAGQS